MGPYDHFIENNAEMLDAATRCIELKQHLPALVLIYSHIDALAWAGSSEKGERIRETFEAWVSQWLLSEMKTTSPTLTATDLYAARCGVLHSLTSKSKLSSSGIAREIAYAWGKAEASVLDAAIAKTRFSGQLVTIHVDALLDGLRNAAEKFVRAAEKDASIKANLDEAAGRYYATVPLRK